MEKNKLVPMEPTEAMIEAAREHHEGEPYLPVSLYKAMIAAAPAVQGEPVAWQLRTPEGRVILNKELPAWAEGVDGYKITPLYTAPQPAEQQQPCRQSPPDDPLDGLEHRADGEANFHTLSRPAGSWVARIQFNGELHTHEQERILNAMLGDRNVRYGDGYHQGYWDARQESPDVAGLVEALEDCITWLEPYDDIKPRDWKTDRENLRRAHQSARAALATYRKQREGEA